MTTATLASAAEAYLKALGPGLRFEFPLTAFDAAGIPVSATWWHAGDGATVLGGIGYGPTYEQARVGALGETAEHAFSVTSLHGRGRVEGSYAQLRRRAGDGGVLDPRLLGLPAGVPFDDDRPLQWLPMNRLDDSEVLVPAEFVASSPGELVGPAPASGWLTTPVSNGLGAGGSLDRAVVHAVLEILQRDGNGLTFRALDQGHVLDLAGVEDRETLDALAALRAAGVEPIAKLAATDLGLPNVYVVGHAPDDDLVVATACGEAVHPDRNVALRKAVLEFASARARKRFMHGPLDTVALFTPAGYLDEVLPELDPAGEEQRVLAATLAWLTDPRERWLPALERTVFSRRTTTPFTALPTTRDGATGGDLLGDLQARLAADGREILVADLTPPGDRGGVRVVKVVVPGLEVETVAYGRIGERNAARLLEAGRDDLVRVGWSRPDGGGWMRIHLTPQGEERLGGPAWLDRQALDGVVDGLLPLYREPGRHTAQLALRARGQA